jgi:hypothetical protein
LYFSFDNESPGGKSEADQDQDMSASYSGVKVFSATKARERESLGERITEWLDANTHEFEVVDTVVTQSSDNEFHCLTITLFFRTR